MEGSDIGRGWLEQRNTVHATTGLFTGIEAVCIDIGIVEIQLRNLGSFGIRIESEPLLADRKTEKDEFHKTLKPTKFSTPQFLNEKAKFNASVNVNNYK